ncbi:hypothetical protein B0H34DRAFT_671964 [Crassisporium funariophilum]|nr:hypothetical protein B0H34DRAFT_671964 [Crassisporium funariophilum]
MFSETVIGDIGIFAVATPFLRSSGYNRHTSFWIYCVISGARNVARICSHQTGKQLGLEGSSALFPEHSGARDSVAPVVQSRRSLLLMRRCGLGHTFSLGNGSNSLFMCVKQAGGGGRNFGGMQSVTHVCTIYYAVTVTSVTECPSGPWLSAARELVLISDGGDRQEEERATSAFRKAKAGKYLEKMAVAAKKRTRTRKQTPIAENAGR